MKKRRILAMLAAMTMAATTVMTGCGDNNAAKESTDKVTSESKESQATQASEEELEPVTLKYWMGAEETEDAALVVDAVNEYLADVLPNTTLEIEWVSLSEWSDRWSKAMASQEAIDIAWFGWMNSLTTEVEMGSLMPIEDLVNEYGQGIIETLTQATLDEHRAFDGEMYFLPAWQGLIGERYGIYLPHDNVALLGDEWAENFQKVLYDSFEKNYYDDESKGAVIACLEEYLEASKEAGMLGYGLNVQNDPLNKVYQTKHKAFLNIPSFIYPTVDGDTLYLEPSCSEGSYHWKRIEAYHDWYKKGYIREDVASAEVKETTYSLDTKDNNYITAVANAWTDGSDVTMSVKAGYDIDCFYVMPYAKKSTGFATGTVIPATAENPERAMMLLDLIYTDPTLYQMLVYGVEGTHYTKNTDGTITMAENNKYTGPQCWQLGTCINSLTTDATQLDYYQKMKDAEATAKVAEYSWSGFDKTNVDVEISNITAISKEYVMNALVPLDNWKELKMEEREKMLAAGLDKVMDEVYNQLLPVAEEWGLKLEIRGY